jgi:hypothetical protein
LSRGAVGEPRATEQCQQADKNQSTFAQVLQHDDPSSLYRRKQRATFQSRRNHLEHQIVSCGFSAREAMQIRA